MSRVSTSYRWFQVVCNAFLWPRNTFASLSFSNHVCTGLYIRICFFSIYCHPFNNSVYGNLWCTVDSMLTIYINFTVRIIIFGDFGDFGVVSRGERGKGEPLSVLTYHVCQRHAIIFQTDFPRTHITRFGWPQWLAAVTQ